MLLEQEEIVHFQGTSSCGGLIFQKWKKKKNTYPQVLVQKQIFLIIKEKENRQSGSMLYSKAPCGVCHC